MNGEHSNNPKRIRPLKPGVSVPSLTFFHENEDLDLPTLSKHCLHLAQAGLTSITLLGSNGEAAHVLPDERSTITRSVRETLDSNGFSDLPLIVGCSAQSVRETVAHCRVAYEAGADYAIVLPPSYYRPFMTDTAITEYFLAVANASPIGIVIYNYPGAVAGVDLSSDVIVDLAKHPNIVGCKLTCGNTGKLARIAHSTNSATPKTPTGFMCMGGSADFTLQTMIAGGSGIITGLGNLIPRLCVRLFDMYAQGDYEEAQKMQATVAQADWAVIQGNVPGTKALCQKFYGYGGVSRRPLPAYSQEDVDRLSTLMQPAYALEKRISNA